jgi:hypothetical protein
VGEYLGLLVCTFMLISALVVLARSTNTYIFSQVRLLDVYYSAHRMCSVSYTCSLPYSLSLRGAEVRDGKKEEIFDRSSRRRAKFGRNVESSASIF